jgi:cellulose synthase/poly-beta-1,6-N-acetylglucosamine synthase-like glycosyltransferase
METYSLSVVAKVMLPLISIAIPTFNSAQFASECVTSLAKQDYPALEAAVVDNCKSMHAVYARAPARALSTLVGCL